MAALVVPAVRQPEFTRMEERAMDKINATPVRLAKLQYYDTSDKRTVRKSAHGGVQDILVAPRGHRVGLRRVCDPPLKINTKVTLGSAIRSEPAGDARYTCLGCCHCDAVVPSRGGAS